MILSNAQYIYCKHLYTFYSNNPFCFLLFLKVGTDGNNQMESKQTNNKHTSIKPISTVRNNKWIFMLIFRLTKQQL